MYNSPSDPSSNKNLDSGEKKQEKVDSSSSEEEFNNANFISDDIVSHRFPALKPRKLNFDEAFDDNDLFNETNLQNFRSNIIDEDYSSLYPNSV